MTGPAPTLEQLREQILGSPQDTSVTGNPELDSLRNSILTGRATAEIEFNQPQRVQQLMQDNEFPTPFESDVRQGIDNENLLDPILGTAVDFGNTMMDNGTLLGHMIRNPIESSIALFGGLKDMIWEPAKALVGAEDPEDFEQAKQLWKLMGTAGGGSLLGAGVGFLLGGPLGAGVLGVGTSSAMLGMLIGGAAGGLAGDVAGEMLFLDRTAGEATADAIFWSALTLGVGAVGKKAVTGTLRAAQRRVGRLLQEDLLRAGDSSAALSISQLIDENLKGSRSGVWNIEAKGYLANRMDDGSWEIVDPFENKTIRRGVQTKEELVSHLDSLPDRSRTNVGTIDTGPEVPGQTTARDSWFTELAESSGDFLATNGKWIANVEARSNAAERALSEILGREVSLNQNIIRPLVRASTALSVARREAFKLLDPIAKLENSIFRLSTRSTRALRRQEYGQYMAAQTIDELARTGAEGTGRAINTLEKNVTQNLFEQMERSGLTWSQIDTYSNKVRNTLRINNNKGLEITDDVIAKAHADVADALKFTDAQKATAGLYDGLLDRPLAELDILNVIEGTKALQRGNVSRSTLAKELKLTSKELRLIEMMEREAAKHPLDWGDLDNATRSAMRNNNFKTTTPALVRELLSDEASVWANMYENNLAGYAFRDKLDPMQSLSKRIGDALWGEHVGTAWEQGRRSVANTLREADQIAKGSTAKVGSATRTPLAQGMLSFFEDMRSLQAYDSIGLEKNLDQVLGRLGFEGGSAVTVINAMTLLHGTGLLGFRPKLALRDLFDAWGFYAAFTDFKTANGAITQEARHIASVGMDAWRKEVVALEKQGRISQYSFQSQLRDITRSVSGQERVPGRLYRAIESFSRGGEAVSMQHKMYTFNQKAIYSQEVRRVSKILNEFDISDVQKNQAIRDTILDKAKIRGSDATLKHFNDLLIKGTDPVQFIEEAAESMVIDILGRFGHGFGPAGHGMFSRIFLTFRTFPSVRINALQKMLTKGTASSKRGAMVRLALANGALQHAVSPALGLRPGYLSLMGGTLYTGGPMLDIVHDLGEAASFGMEGAEADVLARAAKQFIPLYAFKDIKWMQETVTDWADVAVEGWDMLRP